MTTIFSTTKHPHRHNLQRGGANFRNRLVKPAQKPAKPAGFTIIEVALVLAVAGLIFLVVFLALPALQRSQRDNARKQDVARIVAALQQYKADHQGELPPSNAPTNIYNLNPLDSEFAGYIGKLSQIDKVAIGGPKNPTLTTVVIAEGSSCYMSSSDEANNKGNLTPASGAATPAGVWWGNDKRGAAVAIRLESLPGPTQTDSAGNYGGQMYCANI